MPLTSEADVQRAAPDSRALAAARSVAKPEKWRRLGRDKQILWGTAMGSGGDYQVHVDVATGALDCSCPSRKRPCKHALGLMLLEARSPDTIDDLPVPDGHRWAAEERYGDSWE